ncbi:carboxypeptidase B-like [Anticarsia gemmatalis]|uniref:carboxypeptidase B-like n=1 Tax=Anticarsia gemmatalis TaxID=129554 RepID=UPI003F759551
MERLLVVLVAVVTLVASGRHDEYASNSVIGIKLRDRSDLKLLSTLESDLDLDIWQDGMPGARDAMVMTTPATQYALIDALDNNGVEYYVVVQNVAKHLEEEEDHLFQWRSQRNSRMIFQDYPRYAEIEAYMESIANQYPNLATLVTAGPSYEGRIIKYLKISTTNFTDTSKPIYFMDAMIHAREWVTTPVALYSIYRLVENLRTEDADLRTDVDWIILPVVNPDGYEYTHTNERLWRKTRSINPLNATCIGVDANRNFDASFNTVGVSSNPCAITYPGITPFSEPETGYIRDIMAEYLNRIQIYMNIHSYGNYVLFGFGDHSLPSNAVHVHHVGAAMGAAIDTMKLPQAGYYLVGNSASVLYSTSGSAQDYGQLVGIPFSYTLELPGYSYLFSVPPEYVDQINEETWRGIAVSARLAKLYYGARSSN